MRSAAQLILLALLLLLLVPGPPAWAGDWVEGDGFRFRLPPEFVDIKKSKMAGTGEIDQALKLMDGMLPSGVDLDMKAFVRQRGSEPDAVLFAMAMHMEGAMLDRAEKLDVDTLERGMREVQSQIDAQGKMVEISRIRKILVSAGRPALELEINIDEPEAGPLNSVRVLFVLENGSFCMLGFQGMRKNAAEDAMLWRAIVTSYRLEARGSIVALLMRYGPFILGGLVILIALLFLRKSSPQKLIRPVLASRPAEGGGGEAGFSRALDGLPMYGQASGEISAPAAGGPPPAQELPVSAPGPAPSGPVKAPTIPRVAPPIAHDQGGPGAPLEPDRVPLAGNRLASSSGGPSGLPRKLPQAQAPLGPPPPLEPPPPATEPAIPTAGALQSPAVAERIEIQDLPAGSDQPTNVAMRSKQPPVPQADSADQVLSRLMGLEDDQPAPEEAPVSTTLGAEARKERSGGDGGKIQRNSDFFG